MQWWLQEKDGKLSVFLIRSALERTAARCRCLGSNRLDLWVASALLSAVHRLSSKTRRLVTFPTRPFALIHCVPAESAQAGVVNWCCRGHV